MSTTASDIGNHKVADGTTRPLQILSWAEKDEQWFKDNVEYFISVSQLKIGSSVQTKDYQLLYDIYNSRFPETWFTHIKNPLNAKNPNHAKFPAQIRPVTILRTNLDLLLGEYPRRPFVYNVANLGETGYNRYMEKMQQTAQQNLTQHFIQASLQEAAAQGHPLTEEQQQQLQQDPPLPDSVKAEFQASYKDIIAIKSQKWLKEIVTGQKVHKKMHRMFKDWLISGEAYSYKAIENEKTAYKRIRPGSVDYGKSSSSDFIEDAEWVVHRDFRTVSDIVDQFYDMLKEADQKKLDARTPEFNTPGALQSFLNGQYIGDTRNQVPVYHVQWKGKKKIGYLSYLDMETFQMVEEEVDENYIVDREKGEQVEWRWVNEVYEGWRIGSDLFVGLRPVPIQRNEISNRSTCKLSYNGRRYSDDNSENVSVLELGIPFQILYIIITYILEKTIAKSKGKIVLMDQATVPNEGGWDEEKFFYYAEAVGYALLNRNQVGVDKTWNQYQVLDMSLFEQIEQLIKLQESIKQQWDDVIGITRQRKGETMASDLQGVNERAVFQSTVITDMIFIGFEELCECDLQGLMDLGKFEAAKGYRGAYRDDDYGMQLLEILPEDFTDEALGVSLLNAAEEVRKLNEMKAYAQPMLQNGHKASTILEIVDAINVAELKAKLKQIEAIDAQIEQANAQSEQEAEKAADQRKKDFAEWESLLTIKEINAKYDRQEDIEMLKGAFNTFTFQNGDANANGVPDAAEVEKLRQNNFKVINDMNEKKLQREQRDRELDMKLQDQKHQHAMDKENLKVDKKKASAAVIKARQKPKSK